MFPGGRHGTGLLFLRFGVAIIAAVQGGSYFVDSAPHTILENIVGAVTVLSGLSLALGFLSPLASTLIGMVVVATGAHWIPSPARSLLDARLPTLLALAMAVSVLILGPGAFSVDARLFGRREIIIPRRPPKS